MECPKCGRYDDHSSRCPHHDPLTCTVCRYQQLTQLCACVLELSQTGKFSYDPGITTHN